MKNEKISSAERDERRSALDLIDCFILCQPKRETPCARTHTLHSITVGHTQTREMPHERGYWTEYQTVSVVTRKSTRAWAVLVL